MNTTKKDGSNQTIRFRVIYHSKIYVRFDTSINTTLYYLLQDFTKITNDVYLIRLKLVTTALNPGLPMYYIPTPSFMRASLKAAQSNYRVQYNVHFIYEPTYNPSAVYDDARH